MSDLGGIEQLLKWDPPFGKGVYIYNGILTNKFMADKFSLSFQDLDLLMAAFL
jgi:alanine dehydrogenase